MERKKILGTRNVFLSILFLFLFCSFAFNSFQIVSQDEFDNFDHFSESLVVGKLARAKHEGIFSQAGFAGVSYNREDVLNTEMPSDYPDRCDTVRPYRDQVINTLLEDKNANIYAHYFDDTILPQSYCPYLTQIGGQAYVYSIIDSISPFSHRTNYMLFKWGNALLIALCITFILGWIQRNFGYTTLLISFVLILLSPWIVLFAGATGSLWWCLWSFSGSFIAMLLLLEKRDNGGDVSNKKIYLYLFATVFIKCFFSGFEFITVFILSLFCPVIFYAYLEKMSFKDLFYFSFKIGIIALSAILFYTLLLLIQLEFHFGNFGEGIDYFINSYRRRSEFNKFPFIQTILIITKMYFNNNIFDWGFLDTSKNAIHFSYLWKFIAICGILIYIFRKKIDRKYISLLFTTAFSILCPLSWFYLFKDHSYLHPHLNFIVWYIPSLILGFTLIGATISLGCKYLKNKYLKS